MSFKKIADQANIIEDDLGYGIDAVMHKLIQEVGEFNDAIQKYRWIYTKSKSDNIDMIYAEAWDVMFNFISILNRLWINPDELEKMSHVTLNKFIERKNLYSLSNDSWR